MLFFFIDDKKYFALSWEWAMISDGRMERSTRILYTAVGAPNVLQHCWHCNHLKIRWNNNTAVEQESTVQPECLAARKVNLCVPVFLPITVYRCSWDLKAALLLCSLVKNCRDVLSSLAVKQTSTTHQRLLDGTGDDMGMIHTHTHTNTTHTHTCRCWLVCLCANGMS